VPCAKREVVRHRGSAVGVEVDRGGRVAGCRFSTQLRVLELEVRLDVEVFAGVIFQCLVDDRDDLVLRKSNKLAGVGNRIAGFIHSKLVLLDREACLGHWGVFIETAALRADVRIDVPVDVLLLNNLTVQAARSFLSNSSDLAEVQSTS